MKNVVFTILNHKNIVYNVKYIISNYITHRKTPLGRWNTYNTDTDVKKKIDFANYDNCYNVIKKK